MNRNDAPQVSATPASISQSLVAKRTVSCSSSASLRVATDIRQTTLRAPVL